MVNSSCREICSEMGVCLMYSKRKLALIYHLRASCPMIFFPTKTEDAASQIQIRIICFQEDLRKGAPQKVSSKMRKQVRSHFVSDANCREFIEVCVVDPFQHQFSKKCAMNTYKILKNCHSPLKV